MDRKLLTAEKEEAIQKEKKKSYFAYGAMGFLFALSLFLLFFFQNRQNSYWILSLVCVFDSLLLLIALYLFTTLTRELNAKTRLYASYKRRKPQSGSFTFLGKEEDTTTLDSLSCYGYAFADEKGRKIVLYALEEESLPLSLGSAYSLSYFGSFLSEVKRS